MTDGIVMCRLHHVPMCPKCTELVAAQPPGSWSRAMMERECRLAALREVREMIRRRLDLHTAAGINSHATNESRTVWELINAMIAKEER